MACHNTSQYIPEHLIIIPLIQNIDQAFQKIKVPSNVDASENLKLRNAQRHQCLMMIPNDAGAVSSSELYEPKMFQFVQIHLEYGYTNRISIQLLELISEKTINMPWPWIRCNNILIIT